MFNTKIWKIVILFLINISIGSQLLAQLPPLDSGWKTTKRGGVAFRVGGNQTLTQYVQYDSLFQAKSADLDSSYHFGMAMWLGRSEFNSQVYRNGIKSLQANGHDLYDLTPSNRINYFSTQYTPSNSSDYTSEPGVDHINGEKICLKFQAVNIIDSIIKGRVDIDGNIVTFISGKQFTSFDKYDYLYFPSLDTLVVITDTTIDNVTVPISDIWGDVISLSSTDIDYYYFDFKDIHMTHEALILLGNETLKLANDYGLERPYRFIVPGTGGTPWGTPTTDIKPTLGDELGYISSQTYFDFSLMTYNESDPTGTKRFGITWGQFYEETWTLNDIKKKIADQIAKHYVLLNHGHFRDNYLQNTADILQWCHDKNIPVLTSVEWSNILYSTSTSTKQDAFVNIFPPLNVDLDGNGVPDGYSETLSLGTLITDDGPTGFGDTCYSSNLQERICYIDGLGGIEKGDNAFEIHTKGTAGGQIMVRFAATGMDNQEFTFLADTEGWIKYDLSLTLNDNHSLSIPTDISQVNVSIFHSNSLGEVRIGGMSLKALDPTPVELTSFSVNETDLGVELDWRTATEVNNYGFEIERTLSPLSNSLDDVIDTSGVESSEWMTVGFVEGHGNSYSPKEYSFVDTSSLSGDVNYRLKQIDTDGTYEYSEVVTISLSIVSVVSPNKMKTNLDQNHPNPFNPSTLISYQLKNPVNVTIKIYDVIGNKVATLIKNEKQSAGSYSIEFNSYDYNNLSSGVYFYQIIAGQYVDTKKMLLLK